MRGKRKCFSQPVPGNFLMINLLDKAIGRRLNK